MPSSAIQQLNELIAEGKVVLVNECNLKMADKAVYAATYENLAKVMIDPRRPNKNKGEVCSLAYAKATGIPVFATDEMNLQPIIDTQLNTGIDDITCIRIVDIIEKARSGKNFWEDMAMNSPFEYQESLNSLHFTEEEKAAIARRAAEAARKQTRPARRPVRRIALIAAAAVLVLAVGTAGATGILRSAAEVFSPLFGGAPAQTEIIDKIGYPVGASDTDNGVTVTADAVMGDAYNAVIVYTISRDDGTRLLPEDITGEMLLVHGNGTDLSILGGSHGSSYFVVEDPAASSIQMVETVSADKPINDCTATGVFENLYKWDEEAGEAVPIIEGKWRLKFEMTYEDSSVTLSGGETFTQDGMTFTIDSITLSPVAYKVDYTVDSEVVWSNSGSGRQSEEDRLTTQRYFENVEILLTLTDGTVIDLSNAGGSIGPEDGVTVCSKGEVFSEVLPMEDMASISVGGVVYDLTVE